MKDLELGSIHEKEQQRDAIHIAIAPVVAGHQMEAGSHVFLRDGVAYEESEMAWNISAKDYIGIVDPYLAVSVPKGQRFWLFLYPQTITSLRHDWTHPAFVKQVIQTHSDSHKAASEKWLYGFADTIGVSYEEVMETCEACSGGDFDNAHILGFDTPPEAYSQAEDMWKHWTVVTGKEAKNPTKSVFRCAC